MDILVCIYNPTYRLINIRRFNNRKKTNYRTKLKENYNILQYKVTALKSSAIAFCFQVVSFFSIIESPDIDQPICWIIYTY
jgi:hypothetical protein